MPDPPPPVTETQDIQTLLTLMTKTFTAFTESRSTTGQHHPKLEECPLKRTSSSLDAWIKEVLLWDESNTGTDPGLSAKKYLKFLDSVYKSEGSTDLKNLVQVEFVENETFDKKGDTVIKQIVKKVEEKLGQTDLEKCSDAWLQFINIKQEPGESASSFVAKFEKAETQLTNVKIIVPNKALAIHLMNRSNMEEQSKENVLTKTKLDDENEIYPSMKKSIREMKGKLTKNEDTSTGPKTSVENKTYYGRQENVNSKTSRERSASRFRSDENNRETRNPDERPWRKDQQDRRSRKDRSSSRYGVNRQYSQSRNRSRDFYKQSGRQSFRKGDGDSYRNRNSYRNRRDEGSSRNRRDYPSRDRRDYSSRDRRDSAGNGKRSNSRDRGTTSAEVNVVHFSEYCKDTLSNSSEVIGDNFDNYKGDDKDFIEVVYSEGNCDIDPYKLVVDNGCPKTVTGQPWMDAFIESKGDIQVKLEKENQKFRFGPSQTYTSNKNYEIEVNIGDLKELIKVSVVDADIPLLLGLDYQTKWGMVMDIGEKNIFIKKSNQSFKIPPSSSHWTLPVQNSTLHKQAKNLVFNVNLLDMNESKLRKHVKKVHKNLSHKTEEQLVKLFQMAGKDTTKVRNIIKHVVETCNICRRFKKTPPRPKVAMPKAFTINEVVSVDLKERRDLKKQILYMCDEFSGYMVAEVLNNKLPETVIKAFDKRWVREGPGIPDKGIFADNGGEFKNPLMKEVAAKYGLSLRLTAAYSPWSNGKNERNHYTCDVIIDKLMEEDPKLTLDEAVSHAVNSKNMQITRKGFSPRQLMFGKQGVVPGITDGNPASMEPVTESDSFRRAFGNRQLAEELYRKVDSNERIQKALAQNTQGYSDHRYSEGEQVLFKEDGKSRWSSPGQVTGMEGNKVRIIQAGYDRTVPACRVIPFKNEKYLEEEETDVEAENEDENSEAITTKEIVSVDDQEPVPIETTEMEEVYNKEARPKLHSKITFKVVGDENWRSGKVSAVGKTTGKDKFRCWIKCNDGTDHFDFVKDISQWKYSKVEFSDESKGLENSCGVVTEILYTGVKLLKNKEPFMYDIEPQSDNLVMF